MPDENAASSRRDASAVPACRTPIAPKATASNRIAFRSLNAAMRTTPVSRERCWCVDVSGFLGLIPKSASRQRRMEGIPGMLASWHRHRNFACARSVDETNRALHR